MLRASDRKTGRGHRGYGKSSDQRNLLGVLAATLLVLAIVEGLSWSTLVGAFLNFALFVIVWRGAKKQDREYQERMERLDERMGATSSTRSAPERAPRRLRLSTVRLIGPHNLDTVIQLC